MQSLTFITFIVVKEIATLKFLPRWILTRPADRPNTDHHRDSFFISLISPLTARDVGAPQMISQPMSSIFSVPHCPLGLGELQASPFPDVFPPLPLSALSPSPFHCALQNGSGQTWWTGDMSISLQFAFLYDGQEVFVWSDCLLDLGTDFLVGNMVFEWDTYYLAVAPQFHGLYSSVEKRRIQAMEMRCYRIFHVSKKKKRKKQRRHLVI